jgi:dsDNA-specific endonuclease/ATPase MutS2
MRLVNAFHPLLLLRNKEEKKEIYPQTLTLTEHNRILCISGPNAGGKSITLKTVGLLQLMIQSGILVPVHPKSEMFFLKKLERILVTINLLKIIFLPTVLDSKKCLELFEKQMIILCF